LDDDWLADYHPDYDKRKEEGGDWEHLKDEIIVQRQVQEFLEDQLDSEMYREKQIQAAREDDDQWT